MRNPTPWGVLVLALSVGVLGCSPDAEDPPAGAASDPVAAAASNAGAAGRCEFPDASGEPAPSWVCGAPDPRARFSAVGSAPASKAGANFTRQMATAAARRELARIIGTGEDGSVAADLAGTRVIASQTSPSGTVYVLVGVLETDRR